MYLIIIIYVIILLSFTTIICFISNVYFNIAYADIELKRMYYRHIWYVGDKVSELTSSAVQNYIATFLSYLRRPQVKEQLETFQSNGSDFIAHPIMNEKLGIESSNENFLNLLSSSHELFFLIALSSNALYSQSEA